MDGVLAQSLRQVRALSSQLIVFGIGDSGLVEVLLSSPQTRGKEMRIIAFPGDSIPDRSLWSPTTRIDLCRDWIEVQRWILAYFSDHADIVRLGGADILSDHPLCERAELARMDILPRALAMLSDRSWSLGNDVNDTFMGLYHAMRNAPVLLEMPSIGQWAAGFGQTPCISVGAGPSLATHIDRLRELQNKCLIVSCDAAYNGLVSNGIIPHLVTPLERLKQQFPMLTSAAGTRTIFCGIAACHPDVVALFGRKALYFHALDKLYDWLAPRETLRCLTGSSTGVLSVFVAASLARGPLYLVGHDLSLDKDVSHWDGSGIASDAFTQESKGSGAGGSNGYERRWIPGNGGKPVESIMWWDHFRGEIASQAAVMGDRVINVNAHTGVGAVIEHTISGPLPAAESLPDIPDPVPNGLNFARLSDWRQRAKKLPHDCDMFLRSMDRLRADIRKTRGLSKESWNLDGLMRRVAPDSGVSPGNAAAFQYILRSVFHNEQVVMQHRARYFCSRENAQWETMRNLDSLADAMSIAVDQMRPLMGIA